MDKKQQPVKPHLLVSFSVTVIQPLEQKDDDPILTPSFKVVFVLTTVGKTLKLRRLRGLEQG